MSSATTDAKRRVKLYALNANRQWDDKGTGHVASCYHEPLDGMSLLVRNESDGSLLLESKIQIDTMYQKQQGTLIVWTESDNYDLALSFQEQDGCNEIWEKICQVQGRDPKYEYDQDEESDDIRLDLVDCEKDKLNEMLEQINAYSETTRRRDGLARVYVDNDYISRLLEIFRQADEQQDMPTLYKLYDIFKQLFLYDRPTLTETLLAESVLMDVIGVFEYEPPPPVVSSNQSIQMNQEEDNEEDEDEDDGDNNNNSNNNNNNNNNNDAEPPATDQQQAAESEVDPKVTKDNEEQQQPKADDEKSGEISTEETAGSNDSEQQVESVDQPTPSNSKDSHKEETTTKDTTDKQQENILGVPLKSSYHQDIEASRRRANQNQTNNHRQQQQQQHDEQTLQSTNPPPRKRHREFLQNGTTFKEVIPFSNQKLVDKIHQTYRVQYLQSTVLPSPSILEENAYGSLTNILFFNKVEIVSMIQENGEFLQDLFNQIISQETGLEKKRELVLFLREYCIFSQTIQPKQRESFFKTLASLKILSAVEVALSSNDMAIKSAAIDIFTHLVEYNPHMTREHAVQQREGLVEPPNNNAKNGNILKLVIEHITTDEDPELGTATQLSCIIKLLLDPENMHGDTIGKHSFLEFFYYSCMQSLVEPIRNATTSDGDVRPSANDRRTAQLLSIMLELLTFFMEHHYNQLRNYIISSDLLTRIISLSKSRHKFLVLSAIRFFRRLLATKDNVYLEAIMGRDLFSPIISVFKNNGGRYNLLDSAILEMFEYIVKERMLELIVHIITNFGPFLESVDYVSTFKEMRSFKVALYDHPSPNDNPPPSKSPRSSPDNQQIYFGNHSRREDIENISWCMEPAEADSDEVGDVDTDPDKEIDPDSSDANVDSEPDLNLPDLEFTMNGSRDEDEEIDEDEDEEEELGEGDDIRMDDEECDDELEPQFKRKKTK